MLEAGCRVVINQVFRVVVRGFGRRMFDGRGLESAGLGGEYRCQGSEAALLTPGQLFTVKAHMVASFWQRLPAPSSTAPFWACYGSWLGYLLQSQSGKSMEGWGPLGAKDPSEEPWHGLHIYIYIYIRYINNILGDMNYRLSLAKSRL